MTAYRYEGDEVNITLAKSEAKILHEKISNKAYNDEDLIRILATRSKAQINATLNQYKNVYGNDIDQVPIWSLNAMFGQIFSESLFFLFFKTFGSGSSSKI